MRERRGVRDEGVPGAARRRRLACLRSTRAIIATITVMAALAGMPSEASACTLPDDFARLASPEAEIAYRLLPEQLKVGQFFAAEVIACRAPGPEACARSCSTRRCRRTATA